jgi:BASS family bile acid:Na+ symporter
MTLRMSIDPIPIIRGLTMACLFGLLLAVGLRLTMQQVIDSLRRCRLTAVLVANFLVVPALVLALVKLFALSPEMATGMILLGCAPFAPVVPVFTRMVRADLALAAGLTSLVPLLSAVLTPLACKVSLLFVPPVGDLQFHVPGILLMLTGTIIVPLFLGMGLNHVAPRISGRVLRPMEIVSEATGALSLTVVTVTQFHSILQIGWRPLLAMVLAFELALAIGYSLGGSERAARRVVALGTSNRNIALALLLAVASFPGTEVMSAVVANGMVLILLGLVHVGVWRFIRDRRRTVNPQL